MADHRLTHFGIMAGVGGWGRVRKGEEDRGLRRGRPQQENVLSWCLILGCRLPSQNTTRWPAALWGAAACCRWAGETFWQSGGRKSRIKDRKLVGGESDKKKKSGSGIPATNALTDTLIPLAEAKLASGTRACVRNWDWNSLVEVRLQVKKKKKSWKETEKK